MIYNEGYNYSANASANGPGDTVRYIAEAHGCHIRDRAGREYIDLAMGGGSMILGHAHPVVVEAVRKQVVKGSIYTAPHIAVHELDELLDQCIPWLPGRVWCNSGSEAVMRLVRIARAVTGKHKIGLFSGCWHGSWDGTLVEEDYRYSNSPSGPVCHPKSSGLPEGMLDSIVLLPYRDSAAINLIREHASELACVLIEPVQGSNPSANRCFLPKLHGLCRDLGVLLAFDEVVTGFRLGFGGGQGHFGVHGDLAAYGKILGGGLPVGMVAGTQPIMHEARGRGVFYGGTFSANPMTIAAGLATLRYLVQHPETYDHLATAGSLLRSSINWDCQQHSLPAHMMGVGSISRLILAAERVNSRRERDLQELGTEAQQWFYTCVKAHGVWIGTNRIQFLSTQHGVSEIGKVAAALCKGLSGAVLCEQLGCG